ncbi:DUF1479 domain-containing protein [Aspergillus ruber CBS 135680]|uniref:DUF1479-domain-containing protein n=1 Tax=Aspergillus ruber (strain CBS 135680) TaxID=1388766 RepID=A0A017S992_ASPRC|nr:DUF1479-domain-containing protein [Aspergillus ruber CBS 135680]EYE93391.1 DUF1479-domain-containing protein [Aspergillus ruber CBS 135680]
MSLQNPAPTSTQGARKEGDISSVFVSLSGKEKSALPERFADQKKRLIAGREDQIQKSWDRLLRKLKDEVNLIEQRGSDIVPSIDIKDIHSAPKAFQDELRKRGVAVIRGVIPEHEARCYKDEIEQYAKANPETKAFPPHDPQVYELYWSNPQIRARTHPNMLEAQRFLMSFWKSNASDALISPTHPLTYADRLRIRQPGDAGFALGPHIDGGSCERWEDNGYGRGDVYKSIWEGNWEQYDPWEASCRVPAEADLYNGAGACSMFRMFQAWLSMSHSGPNEGTLLVNPLLSMATAYFLLRPFFEPIYLPPKDCSRMALGTFLDPSNWCLEKEMSSGLQGATPGYAQELSTALHPHLELDKTMVHVPKIAPGDYVAWHCDTIHAVDKVHNGFGDSSVMYIPACPVTEANAAYVARQRNDFVAGVPPPDFPGGKGECEHVGRATEAGLRGLTNELGLRAFGFGKWNLNEAGLSRGQQQVLEKANQILSV